MAEDRPSKVLGSLPRARPERRSTKRPTRDDAPAEASAPRRSPASRAAKPSASPAARRSPAARAAKPSARLQAKPPSRTKRKSETLRQPPQPRGIPSQPRSPAPPHPDRPEILGTAIQAVAELAEIGMEIGTRVLRRAVSRLPRP